MAAVRKKTPDFFEENPFDPVNTATGSDRLDERNNSSVEEGTVRKIKKVVDKKKAGFYISADLLNRFTRKFHELKLDGCAIENKSAFVEIALAYTLDDIDKGEKSRILKKLQ